MSEYFIYVISVLGTVAFCSFASYGGRCEKYTRFVLGAILLSALAVPTVRLFSDLSFTDFSADSVAIGESYTAEVLEEAYTEGIARAVEERFELSRGTVSVSCEDFSQSSVSARIIYVKLEGDAAFSDVRGVRNYVSESFGECEVSVKLD